MITIDRELERDEYSNQCSICKHLTSSITETCKAYPDKIPTEIWNNNKKHDKIIEGQEGEYIFERKK